MAHDLKNSLGTIRLRADLLLEQLETASLVPDAEASLSFRGELARIRVTSQVLWRAFRYDTTRWVWWWSGSTAALSRRLPARTTPRR